MIWSIAQILLLSQICLCRDGTIEESMRTKRVIAYLDPKSRDFSRYERKKVVETFHHIVKKILPPYNPNETNDIKELDTKSSSRRLSLKSSKHSNDRTNDRRRRDIDIPGLFDFDVEDAGGGDVLSEYGGYSVKMLDDVPKSSLSPDLMETFNNDPVDVVLTDRPRLVQEWAEVGESPPGYLSLKRVPNDLFGTSEIKEVSGGDQQNDILKPFGKTRNKDEDLNGKQDNLILIGTSTQPLVVSNSKEEDPNNEEEYLISNSLSTEQTGTSDYREDLISNQKDITLNSLIIEPTEVSLQKGEDLITKQDYIILVEPSTEAILTADSKEDYPSKSEDKILNKLFKKPIVTSGAKKYLNNKKKYRISNNKLSKTTFGISNSKKDKNSKKEYTISNRLSIEALGTSQTKDDLNNKEEYIILNRVTTETTGTSDQDLSMTQEYPTSNNIPSETIDPSTSSKDLITRDCNSTDTTPIQIDQDEPNKLNDPPTEPHTCNRTRKRKFTQRIPHNSKHSPKTYVVQIQGESGPEHVVTSDMDVLRSLLLANESSSDSTPRRDSTNKHVDDDSRVLLLWVLGSVLLLGILILSRKKSLLSKQ